MSITREQVRDLRSGDVVRFHYADWPTGTFVQGPLYQDRTTRGLCVGGHLVRYDEDQPLSSGKADLTVISRAKPPLYVNHDRTEPVPGDVVRNADAEGPLTLCWIYDGDRAKFSWQETSSDTHWGAARPWPRLRLLVDGETGEVVR